MKSALIIVDIQNDFLEGGALSIKNSNLLLPFIYTLLDYPFNFLIATKDFHPKKHVSFATTHNMPVGTSLLIEKEEQILWPEHCIENTEGADFPPSFPKEKLHKIFYKGNDPLIDSYSTFFDNAHHKSTGLATFLKERGVTTLFFVGIATEYCVQYSVLDGLELGFTVFVIKDGCKGVNLTPVDEENAFKRMEEKGAHLISFSEVAALLKTVI